MTAESASDAAAATQTSPDELLASFSESHVVRWFLVALLIHAVVIGGMSVGTIRDWADPEGAKARKEAAIAAAKAAAPAEAAAAPATDQEKPTQAAADSPGQANPAAATTAADAKTPIEKATTESAKPEEIPSAPDDLGLSIEDTNPN